MTEASGSIFPSGPCRDIFEHWQELCRSSDAVGGIPVRYQVDLLTLPRSTIPHFTLVERVGHRYRGRFCGTSAAESLGVEITGRFLDDLIDPDVYEDRKVLFDRCVDHSVAVHYRARLARPRKDHLAFGRMLLPLRSSPDSPVDMVFGVMRFMSVDEFTQYDADIRRRDSKLAIFQTEYRNGVWMPFQAPSASSL